MRWGLYDTQDDLWLGNDDGPLSFGPGDDTPSGIPISEEDAELIARAAAQINDTRMGWEVGRTRAKQLPDGINKKRDEVEPRMTTLRAIQRQERGLL